MLFRSNQLKRHPKLKFVLAGKLDEHGNTNLGNGHVLPISPKAYIESFIKENKLEEQLIVTGFRDDILELIAAMDVLVVPNKNGVLGRQPIEAQALGVTVLAQAGHSKKSKIIQHSETGYLVQNPEQMIEQIEYLLKHKEVEKISRAAQAYAEQKFTPATNMKKIENIYLSLINH